MLDSSNAVNLSASFSMTTFYSLGLLNRSFIPWISSLSRPPLVAISKSVSEAYPFVKERSSLLELSFASSSTVNGFPGDCSATFHIL